VGNVRKSLGVRGTTIVMVVAAAVIVGPLQGAGASDGPTKVTSGAIARPDLVVIMEKDATPAQLRGVRRAIRRTAAVRRYAPLGAVAALRLARQQFHDDTYVEHLTVKDFPKIFYVELHSSASEAQPVRKFKKLDGVAAVTRQATKAETIRTIAQCARLTYNLLEIFMSITATPTDVDAVRHAIEADPDATLVEFLDHDAAYRAFRDEISDQKLRQSITPADLPESFQIVVPAESLTAARTRYEAMAGVEATNMPCEAVRSARGADSSPPATANVPPPTLTDPALSVPAGVALCRADELEYAGGGLTGLLRFFNRSGGPCGLAGYPTLLGRAPNGTWVTIPTRLQSYAPVSGSPPWTGVFDPTKTAVVSIGPGFETSALDCPGNELEVQQYSGLRLVLPQDAGTIDIPDAGTFALGPCQPTLTPFTYDTTTG
jgi:cell division protein FtsX